MAVKYIPAANPGTDLKFRVMTTKDDFNLSRDPFNIIIKNKYGRVVKRLTKSDCLYDSEFRWYFNVENIQTGVYYAIFLGSYDDDDYAKQRRIWTDRQLLFICREGCMMTHLRARHPQSCPVSYEQVWSVSIDGEDYLADRDGNYIYTSDGKRIQFSNKLSNQQEDMGKVKMNMSGDEFLQLIEGKDPNGEVNTLPELMEVMRGVDDAETIPQKIQDEIDDSEQENEASDDDIDEIFDNELDND